VVGVWVREVGTDDFAVAALPFPIHDP
jgi:hypothetical protein